MVLCAGWRGRLGNLIWPGGGPRHFGTREALKETLLFPGTAGSGSPGSQWALLAVFDVASCICQDNDEAGTIYLVCSPQTPRSFLPLLGPHSLSLRRIRCDLVGTVLVLLVFDQILKQIKRMWIS